MALDLFQTGVLCRCPGGGPGEDVRGQKDAGVKWAALNLGADPCVLGDPSVWDLRRTQYASAGIPVGPWKHCHSIADVKWLISIGEQWDSPFIGVNVEDVVADKLSLEELGKVLLDLWVNKYQKPVHMPTLPWVQNEQGWEHVSFAYITLEMFPEEGNGQLYLDKYQACIDHAFAEGAKLVTLLYSTKTARSAYPNVAHCLYTADNVTSWPEWKDTVPQVIPKKEAPPVADPWYSKPYKKGSAVGPSKLPRDLKFEVGNILQGDDVLAVKRIVSHAQRWLPWAPSQWDKRYSQPFAMGKGTGNVGESGVRGFQRQEGLPQTGIVDNVTYQRMRKALIPTGAREGDHILDTTSTQLIIAATKELAPAGKIAKIRAAMADFCERAESSEAFWHYTQNRPFSGFGVAPERNHEGDCSAYCILTYYWARQQAGILVPDPSGYRYTGYGNTWDDLDGHPRVTSGNYQVGDLAHYDGHVTICRKPGDASSSVWSSFGQESGPNSETLFYRGDFRFVVRPQMLPVT